MKHINHDYYKSQCFEPITYNQIFQLKCVNKKSLYAYTLTPGESFNDYKTFMYMFR